MDLRWKFIKDCIDNGVLKRVPLASDKMIADIGTAARPARPAPAIQITTAVIYDDLVSLQSVTLPLQPNTLSKTQSLMMSVLSFPLLLVDALDPQAKLQVRLSFQRHHSLHTE